MRLVLFDIDGTLITDNGAARNAYGSALSAVYGFEGELSNYDFSGLTDRQITDMVLGDARYSEQAIRDRIDQLWERYLSNLQKTVSETPIRVLPGVAELLMELSRRADVVMALLTGNLEDGARIKLTPPGLNHYFPFGAFGSDSKDRNDLPPIAVERATAITGHRFEGREVVIIGDSIYDIRCGVPHQATTIGVSSGRTSAEKLRAENPDHLFSSLQPTSPLLEAILNPP